MEKIALLANALEFIESNLTSKIKTDDIADACYCSKSALEKLFRCVNHISVHDYIVRRRMMKAAKAIYEEPERSLLDVALQFGYSSNEAFTHAFKQIWNCKPSEFRRRARYSELFPRFLCPLENGDDYMKERKHVDISELYDLFSERKNCYFVCCDIKSLLPINEISIKAGDLAIIESMNRMNEAAGEEDVVFRIGGDEFVLLTNREDIHYAEKVAGEIAAHNGETFSYETQEIPLSLHTGITKFEGATLKYNDLFVSLHTVIKESK